jgi:hypothetical protein
MFSLKFSCDYFLSVIHFWQFPPSPEALKFSRIFQSGILLALTDDIEQKLGEATLRLVDDIDQDNEV